MTCGALNALQQVIITLYIKKLGFKMEEYKIKSTSRNSAKCDEIVLRETSNTRLVFKPLLVNNKRTEDASLKGTFVFQKKLPKENWIDLKDLNLNQLRSGEYVKLELKSEELLNLIRQLIGLYKLYKKDGLPFGETRYIKAQGSLSKLSEINEEDLKHFFLLNKKAGINVFSRLLNYVINLDNADIVADRLEKLDINSLQRLNTLIGISNLKKVINNWRDNATNPNEEYWQNQFLQNPFILSQVFPYPIILLKDKAYVGGKTFDNTGGNLVDFLCKNDLTQNAVLIEIKTPTTPLLSKKYRSDIYNISSELSGATLQISNYRRTLSMEYYNVSSKSSDSIEPFHPQCVVIIGSVKYELTDSEKRKSFELFRNDLKDIQILTYDELFGKLSSLIDMMEGYQ